VLEGLVKADAIVLHPENWNESARPFMEAVVRKVEKRGVEVPLAEKGTPAVSAESKAAMGFSFRQPEADTVLVKDFVWVVGSAAEGPGAKDVDVLFRTDYRDGRYSVQSEGAELAVRKSIDPGKERELHYLAHPQGPHQGRAYSLADLVLRWHEPRKEEVKATSVTRVNIGAGDSPLKGYFNVDAREGPGIDWVGDIRAGLPFPDSSVEEIKCDHVLEDLRPEERIPALREIHRVLKPDGVLAFTVPHSESRGAEMPFHLSHWTPETFQAFASPELVRAYDLPQYAILELKVVEEE
jgi:hypothetical protein